MPKIEQFIRLYFDFNTPHNFGCKSIKSVYKNSKTHNPLLPTPCQHFQPVLDQNCLRHLKNEDIDGWIVQLSCLTKFKWC